MKNLLSLLLGFFGLLQFTQAQFQSTAGPVIDMKFDYLWARNDTAFVAFNEDLWHTFNGGNSWELVSSLPKSVDPRAISVARDILFIGTNNFSRSYYSNDWGKTWNNVTSTPVTWVPTHLASNGEEIFMGGTNFGPHKFNFNTLEWDATNIAGTTHALCYLSKDTLISNVGSATGGTGRISTNNGSTWVDFADEPSMFYAKTYDYTKVGDRIIAGTSVTNANPFYTDDLGSTWIESTDARGPTKNYGKAFLTTPTGTILYNRISLYTSTDRGESYQATGVLLGKDFTIWKGNQLLGGGYDVEDYGTGNVSKFIAPSTTGNLVYDGTELFSFIPGTREFFERYKNGTWTQDTIDNQSGEFIANFNFIALDDNPNQLYFGSSLGLHIADKEGVVNKTIYSDFESRGITAFAKIDGKYYVGAAASGFNGTPVIFSSNDLVNWTKITFSNSVGKDAFGNANSLTAFIKHNNRIFASMAGGYARLSQDGTSLEYFGDANFGKPVSLASVGNQLIKLNQQWCAQCASNNLEISDDLGDTWSEFQNGIPGYTGQSNFTGIGNLFQIGNQAMVQVFGDGVLQLVSYGAGMTAWEIVPNSQGAPEGRLFTQAIKANTGIFASCENLGVYQLGSSTDIQEKNLKNKVICFPNPTQGWVELKSDKRILGIRLMSMDGKTLSTIHSDTRIDLSSYQKGTYLLEVISAEDTQIHRIVKQ